MDPRPRSGRPLAWAALLTILIGLAAPSGLNAQDTDSLRVEVARLAALVDSLRAEVTRLQAEGQEEEADDALARLREAAAAAAAAGGGAAPADAEDQEFVGRQRSLQSLNPEISMNADVFGHINPDDANDNNFFPREFELSLQSALDPFSRAKLFISRHGQGPEVVPFVEEGEGHGHADEHEEGEGGGGFDIEEGYVEWVSLPGGLGLKLGKFQQRFGSLNRWHAHALPFQSRSLPHLAYLGEEALSQAGASVSWLAPFGGGASGTYEFGVEVTRSENAELFGESARPSVLGHVNGFWQVGGATDVELGLSWINGSFEDEVEFFDRNVFNAEFAFNWIPPARARQTGLTLRGGVMILDGLEPAEDPAVGEAAESVYGLWSMAELRLSRSWLIGARFDRAESPFEPGEHQWLATPTVTWWQSEFVRVRAGYDYLSGFEGGDGTGMFTLQVTFAMGPHKHESY